MDEPHYNSHYIPPGEPVDATEAVKNGAPSGAARKMTIEWFDDAAQAATEETPDPLITGLLDAGAFSVIYGDSNSGKTFVALDMGYHVSTGTLWNERAVKRGLVVYVAAEGGTRIRKRLAALKKHRGNKGAAPLFALIRYPIDLRSSDANVKELIALIRKAEEETAEKCVWVIVDTLSRAMAGGDENSPVDMGRVVAAADLLRDETGAHFTYVHHTGKDAARGARGHSLLRAATDTEIEVTTGAVSATKQRDMESDFVIGFDLCDVQLGDLDGMAIKSAIVLWKGVTSKPLKAENAKPIPRSQRLLMDVIRQAIAEADLNFRPFPDGPIVQVAKASNVKARIETKIAEQIDPADDPVKVAERQRKAFDRAITAEVKAKNLLAGYLDNEKVLWLP